MADAISRSPRRPKPIIPDGVGGSLAHLRRWRYLGMEAGRSSPPSPVANAVSTWMTIFQSVGLASASLRFPWWGHRGGWHRRRADEKSHCRLLLDVDEQIFWC